MTSTYIRKKAGQYTAKYSLLLSLYLFFSIFLSTLPVTADDAPPTAQPIIGGTSSSSTLFPAVAEITIGTGICTGTLISPNYVLTAGHCAFDERNRVVSNMSQITITLGGQKRKARAIHVHPDYDNRAIPCSEGIPDASLIELDTPVTSISPISVATDPPSIGTELLLVGYGILGSGIYGENGQFPESGTLSYGYTYIDKLDSTFIIWKYKSSRGGANTASGDSGGPAFQTVNDQLVLRGITCGGTGNAEYGTDSFDTRTDVLVDWLSQFVSLNTSASPPSIHVARTISARAQKNLHTPVTVSGAAPIKISVDGLPEGLSYNNGFISGIPSTPGSYPIFISAENANGSRILNSTIVVRAPDTVFKVTRSTLQFNSPVFNTSSLALDLQVRTRLSRLLQNRQLTIRFGNYQRTFSVGFNRLRSNSGGDSIRLASVLYNESTGRITLKFKIQIQNTTAIDELLALGFSSPENSSINDVKNLPITFQFDSNNVTINQALSLRGTDLRWHLVK